MAQQRLPNYSTPLRFNPRTGESSGLSGGTGAPALYNPNALAQNNLGMGQGTSLNTGTTYYGGDVSILPQAPGMRSTLSDAGGGNPGGMGRLPDGRVLPMDQYLFQLAEWNTGIRQANFGGAPIGPGQAPSTAPAMVGGLTYDQLHARNLAGGTGIMAGGFSAGGGGGGVGAMSFGATPTAPAQRTRVYGPSFNLPNYSGRNS